MLEPISYFRIIWQNSFLATNRAPPVTLFEQAVSLLKRLRQKLSLITPEGNRKVVKNQTVENIFGLRHLPSTPTICAVQEYLAMIFALLEMPRAAWCQRTDTPHIFRTSMPFRAFQ